MSVFSKVKIIGGNRKSLVAVAFILFPLGLGFFGFIHLKKTGGVLHHFSENAVHVFNKINAIRSIDEENSRLEAENVKLRSWSQQLQFNCAQDSANEETQTGKRELASLSGTAVGRVMETISYRPPEHLTPVELFSLGESYFENKDFEKSAVIFTMLYALEKTPGVDKSKTGLLKALSWYQVDNLKMAEAAIDEVLKSSSSQINLEVNVQLKLFKAVLSKRKKDDRSAQKWLLKLIDEHAESSEAKWINPGESPNRLPSSQHH